MLTTSLFLATLALCAQARCQSVRSTTNIPIKRQPPPPSDSYMLIMGTYSFTVSTLMFSPSTPSTLSVLYQTPIGTAPSWVEPAYVGGHKQVGEAYTLSETGGGVYALREDDYGAFERTGYGNTGASPAHLLALKDGSALIASNYGGGSVVVFPLPLAGTYGEEESPSTNITFPYVNKPSLANAMRQEDAHPHQALEAPGGRIFVNDLGNDRVWVLSPSLRIEGWLQAPNGCGPRHGVFSPESDYYYLACELSSSLLVFKLPATTSWLYPIEPLTHFEASQSKATAHWSLLPPGISAQDVSIAELLIHSSHDKTLYVSLRGEVEASNGQVKGDKIGIISLNEQGETIEGIHHFETGLDVIRGMSISDDGLYLAAAGQEAGGVEIYEIAGVRGETLTLKAKVEGDGAMEGVSLAWV